MSQTHQEHGNKGYIEDQREFFDKLISQDWEAYLDPGWDKVRKIEVQEILRLVPLCHHVLDVGCGCGYHDVVFAQSDKVEQVTGIDYSSKSIEQANYHYPHPKIKRQVADLFELIDEVHAKFNLAVSFQVIEHLNNPQEFLMACANGVVEKGYIAVVTPNRERLQNRVLQLLGRKPPLVDPLHFAEYTIAELIEIGQKANLTCVGYFGHSISLSLKGLTLINGTSSFAVELGQRLPTWSNVIGIVFQKI